MQVTEGTVTDVTIVRQVSDRFHFHSDSGRRIVEGTERGSMTKKGCNRHVPEMRKKR